MVLKHDEKSKAMYMGGGDSEVNVLHDMSHDSLSVLCECGKGSRSGTDLCNL